MLRRSPISALPFERWPAVDRRLFEAACRPGDVLEPAGAAAFWRPRTTLWAIDGYGYWLGWLMHEDCLDLEESPVDRCSRERLRDYLHFLQQHLAPATTGMRLRALKRVLAVMCPEADLAVLSATLRRLDTRPSGDRRSRLRMADELLDFGIALMSDAETSEERLKRRAQRYRNGFIVALLSLRPLRRRNLAGLHLGLNLIQVNGQWRIRIPGEETKNHRPIDEPMPDILIPYLERYLAEFRPALVPGGTVCAPDHGALFLSSRTGRAMAGHTINLTVSALTAERFGKPMTLHMFREAAPTTLAIRAPRHVKIAATINNHADYRTTEQWYNLACTMDAAEAHLTNMATLRRRFRG